MAKIIRAASVKRNKGEAAALKRLELLDDGWTVLQGVLRDDGEADFILLHREFGVVVIEVKGGLVGYRFEADQGGYQRQVWYSSSRRNFESGWPVADWHQPTRLKKDPKKQAQEFKSHLRKAFEVAGLPERPLVTYCLWFPECDPPTQKDSWLILGQSDTGDEVKLLRRLSEVREGWRKTLQDKMPRLRHGWPTVSDEAIQAARQLILPDQMVMRPLLSRDALHASEQHLFQMTEQQWRGYAKSSDLVPRQTVLGLAGTGKTLMAQKQTEKWLLSGRRVLFLVHSRVLAQHLRESLERFCRRHQCCPPLVVSGDSLRPWLMGHDPLKHEKDQGACRSTAARQQLTAQRWGWEMEAAEKALGHEPTAAEVMAARYGPDSPQWREAEAGGRVESEARRLVGTGKVTIPCTPKLMESWAKANTPDDRFDAILVDEGQRFRHEDLEALTHLLKDPDAGHVHVFADPHQTPVENWQPPFAAGDVWRDNLRTPGCAALVAQAFLPDDAGEYTAAPGAAEELSHDEHGRVELLSVTCPVPAPPGGTAHLEAQFSGFLRYLIVDRKIPAREISVVGLDCVDTIGLTAGEHVFGFSRDWSMEPSSVQVQLESGAVDVGLFTADAFRGLENQVVVVLAVMNQQMAQGFEGADFLRSQLYTAATRPTGALFIVSHEQHPHWERMVTAVGGHTPLSDYSPAVPATRPAAVNPAMLPRPAATTSRSPMSRSRPAG